MRTPPTVRSLPLILYYISDMLTADCLFKSAPVYADPPDGALTASHMILKRRLSTLLKRTLIRCPSATPGSSGGGGGGGGGARLEEEEPVHVRRILRSTTNQMLQNAAYCLGVTAAQVRADFCFFRGIAAAPVATRERESARARERGRTAAQVAALVAAMPL